MVQDCIDIDKVDTIWDIISIGSWRTCRPASRCTTGPLARSWALSNSRARTGPHGRVQSCSARAGCWRRRGQIPSSSFRACSRTHANWEQSERTEPPSDLASESGIRCCLRRNSLRTARPRSEKLALNHPSTIGNRANDKPASVGIANLSRYESSRGIGAISAPTPPKVTSNADTVPHHNVTG